MMNTERSMNQNPPAGAPADVSLGEIARVLRRHIGAFLAVLALCLVAAALATRATPKRWRATAEMALVERTAIDSINGDGTAPRSGYTPPVAESMNTQITMLQSDALAQRALARMQAAPDAGKRRAGLAGLTAQNLQRALSVSNPKDTDVLVVTLDAPGREQAAAQADAVCQAFVQWKDELARRQVTEVADALQARSDQAQAQLVDAERQEAAWKRRQGVADWSAQQKAVLDQAQARRAEVGDLQKEALSLGARLHTMEAHLRRKNAQMRDGLGVRDDALVLSLQSQLTQIETARAEGAQRYTPLHPAMVQLDAKIRDTRARLNGAVRRVVTGQASSLQSQGALLEDYQQTQVNAAYTAAKLAAAGRTQSQLDAQIARMPALDAEYKQIARRLALAGALFQSLQTSLASARLDVAHTVGPIQITQPAIAPPSPFRPSRAQNLALGGLAGLFLGGLAVLGLEGTNRRVRDRADAARLGLSPVLGALPPLPPALAASLASGYAAPQVIEAYRQAYAGLRLARPDVPGADPLHHAVILVTGAAPGEGASVTAAHLAAAIATGGKRTILVDADLDRPLPDRSHSGGESTAIEPCGLADMLCGRATVGEAVSSTPRQNLLRIGRGRTVSGAADLIAHPRMEQTLAALRRCADVVVLDAPPCSERADAFFLAPLADCIVQVVGLGRADRASVLQTRDRLDAARPGAVTFFLNFCPGAKMADPPILKSPALRRFPWRQPLPPATPRVSYLEPQKPPDEVTWLHLE